MAFTKAAVEELSALHGEPEWLRARRLDAFGVFEGMSLPDTRRNEDWKQVDLKALNLEAYAAFQQPNGLAPAGTLENVGRHFVSAEPTRRWRLSRQILPGAA